MAQHESDREDLMREVTALVPRIELELPGEPIPVIAGRRRDGRCSVYLSPDEVYHFDAEGRLRRAYVRGHLYRSQGTRLARLTRHRTKQETELLRHDLSPAELEEFQAEARRALAHLQTQLASGDCRVLRQVPESPDFIPELNAALMQALNGGLALAPALKR